MIVYSNHLNLHRLAVDRLGLGDNRIKANGSLLALIQNDRVGLAADAHRAVITLNENELASVVRSVR